MGVNMTMGKQVPQIEEAVAETPITGDARVDELAELLAWQEKLKKDPRTARLAELKAELQKEANAAEGDTVVFEGVKNRYEFGKHSAERKVTVEGKVAFANKVGEEAFLEVASIPLSAIDKYIPKVEQGEYIEMTTGSRSGKMVAKVQPKK